MRTLALVALSLLLAGAARAHEPVTRRHITIFVDAAATGPGSGSEQDPFPTIADAFTVAIPHDFVRIMPGVYHEAVVIPFFIYLQSEKGAAQTIIDATGLPGTHAVVMETLATLEGFTVTKRDGAGVSVSTPPGSPEYARIFRGNRIVDCPNGGVDLVGPTHMVMVECLFHGNGENAIDVRDGASPFMAGCTLTGNATGLSQSGTLPDAQAGFANSIIWGNANDLAGGFATAQVGLINCNTGFASLAGANGNLSVDPGFRDPARLDFRLLAGSPCIDAANVFYTPSTSVFDHRGFGFRRKADGTFAGAQIADLGAFERGGLELSPFVIEPTDASFQIELATGASTEWILAEGVMNTNPTFPLVNQTGFFFLEPSPLTVVLSGVQSVTGKKTFNVGTAGLSGLDLTLQAVGFDPTQSPIVYAFTNAIRIQVP